MPRIGGTPLAHTVECGGCERSVTVTDHGVDVHMAMDAAGCSCCPEAHHHGRATAESGVPCRPLVITLLPGSADLTPAKGA